MEHERLVPPSRLSGRSPSQSSHRLASTACGRAPQPTCPHSELSEGFASYSCGFHTTVTLAFIFVEGWPLFLKLLIEFGLKVHSTPSELI